MSSPTSPFLPLLTTPPSSPLPVLLGVLGGVRLKGEGTWKRGSLKKGDQEDGEKGVSEKGGSEEGVSEECQ